MKREWWHSLTVYQIYTRSFCDSNGDGIGDFGGILQKLDYLQELGVGAIWLSPFNDSPNYDNGYDVSDYYKVMEEAGTMEELEELIAACEKREIVVMMDLVLNHSSHLHPWFLEARKDRNSKYHDFYIWKEGTKEQPPEGGPGITRSDLLVINKIDLAPYVGASLEVMERDSKKMRGERPFLFTNIRGDVHVDDVVSWIKENVLLEGM